MKRVAMGQINTTIGDFDKNLNRITEYSRRAAEAGAELICFPELALTGYPPQDLVERPSFVQANLDALDALRDRVRGIDVVVGYVEPNPTRVGKAVHNAAAYLRDGEIVGKYFKILLPTYDVFNETRYFEPGGRPRVIRAEQGEGRVGLTVCEDVWNDPDFTSSYDQPRYERDPFDELRDQDPGLILNLSASPYVRGKDRFRSRMIRSLARKARTPVMMCNLVGGNDALVFDGNSLLANGAGEVLARGSAFEEDLVVADLGGEGTETLSFPDPPEAVYRALLTGLEDYLNKCGFSKALVGLSGGMDSALTATLAVDALGAERVLGVLMPSEITSDSSVTDARKLAENLGIDWRVFPIQELFDGYLELFSDEFAGLGWDTTEENLQARIRGNILMALSNKYGHILLSTGNKSELAVGYCTLYGDMTGGLAVISDVPKTMVYELARWRNERDPVIPENIFTKPPSAELAPDQKDEDDLPPYEILDQIIELYVEEKNSVDSIIEQGFDESIVREVVRRIDHNEYKRQQAPVGLKVTSKSFGAGRVMPIAQHFEG